MKNELFIRYIARGLLGALATLANLGAIRGRGWGCLVHLVLLGATLGLLGAEATLAFLGALS